MTEISNSIPGPATDFVRCDREASDDTPNTPEIRCPSTTTIDSMDGWLVRNYGYCRKVYCPECATLHTDDVEPGCQWPGCDVHYRPFVAGVTPKWRDLDSDGWIVPYLDGELMYCPDHAERGEARNVEMRIMRGEYAGLLTNALIDLAGKDRQVQALIEEIREAGICSLKIRMGLDLAAMSGDAK